MEVTANLGVVTEALVLQALSSLVSPTALEADKTTFVWQFGEEVPNSRVNSEVFNVSVGNVAKVVITTPSEDVGLEAYELPLLDTANTNIVMLPASNG